MLEVVRDLEDVDVVRHRGLVADLALASSVPKACSCHAREGGGFV